MVFGCAFSDFFFFFFPPETHVSQYSFEVMKRFSKEVLKAWFVSVQAIIHKVFTRGGLRPALLWNLEVVAVFLADKMSFQSCL